MPDTGGEFGKRSVELGDDGNSTFNILARDGVFLISIHGPGGHTAQWITGTQASAIADLLREAVR